MRFVYARENHSFGLNTNHSQYNSGSTSVDLRRGYLETKDGQAFDSPVYTLSFTSGEAAIVHTKQSARVDNYGHTINKTIYGRVDSSGNPDCAECLDETISSHSTWSMNEKNWIHGECESWKSSEDDPVKYDHTLNSYDYNSSSWDSTLDPSAQCPIGAKGLSTKGEYRVYYQGSTDTVEAFQTSYNRWGLPVYTNAHKKMESWQYYEDPSGYETLVTREVIRTGVDGPVLSSNPAAPIEFYPDTQVKYITTRASWDPGLGVMRQLEMLISYFVEPGG